MTSKKATALALRRALGRKLQPDLVDQHGWTDLHYAAIFNLTGLANALLSRGAAVDARLPENAPTAEGVAALLDRFGVDLHDCTGETPLHLACIVDAALVASALASNGADLDARMPTFSNWTPLHVAARYNAVDAATILVLRGARLQLRDEYGAPPLHTAALYNAVATAEVLLAAGASVYATARDDLTALHLAALMDSPGVAARLLDHGADVNALTAEDGTSPLDHALAKGARSTADLLRRRGGHSTVESHLAMKTVLESKVDGQDVLVPVFEHTWVRRPRPHPFTPIFSFARMARDLLTGHVATSEPPGWVDQLDLDRMVLVPVDWVPLEWRFADVVWSIPLRPPRDGATAEERDGPATERAATHLLLVLKFADEPIADVGPRFAHHVTMLMHELSRRGLYGAPDHPPLTKNVVINRGEAPWPRDDPNVQGTYAQPKT